VGSAYSGIKDKRFILLKVSMAYHIMMIARIQGFSPSPALQAAFTPAELDAIALECADLKDAQLDIATAKDITNGTRARSGFVVIGPIYLFTIPGVIDSNNRFKKILFEWSRQGNMTDVPKHQPDTFERYQNTQMALGLISETGTACDLRLAPVAAALKAEEYSDDEGDAVYYEDFIRRAGGPPSATASVKQARSLQDLIDAGLRQCPRTCASENMHSLRV
jgi:hypothetical protein